MYIIGILIGLYLQISIAFLCFALLIILVIIYLLKLSKTNIGSRNYLYNADQKRTTLQNRHNLKFLKFYNKYIIFVCILLIGCIYVKMLDKNYEEKYLDVSDTINIKAIVISEPEDKEYKYTYTVKVDEINKNKKYKNTKLILDINKKNLQGNMPQYGDAIIVTGKFEKPNSARNYKGFDYKEYLKSQKIYGMVSCDKYEIISNKRINIFSNFIHSIRQNIKTNMHKILNEEEAALCVGILIGNREDISEQTEDNFKKSNLTHMLAVSGSHITYIINAMAIVLGKIGKKRTKIFTIIMLIFFMALTGFTASVIRACIMGILVLIANIILRKSDTINNLGISSFIILIFNPYAIIDVGFLLSYGGTIGIVLLGDKITNGMHNVLNKHAKGKIAKYIITSFSITLSANLIIIPIIAYNFSTVSITFWISNILAAPIMEVSTIFGFIVYFISIICFPFAKFLGIFLNFLLFMLLKIAEISSLIPGCSIYIKTPYVLECVIYYLVLAIVFNFNNLKNRLKRSKIIKRVVHILKEIKHSKFKKSTIVILCFTAVIFVSAFSFQKILKIYFVDVGQGDCTLIETPTNKHILIDGGGSEFGTYDVGKNTLLPYLLDRRITTIDYILISHFDSDHIGGLFAIMENLKVENIIIAKQGEESDNLTKFQEVVHKKKINVIVVNKGDYIKIDKYSYFEILFPEENLINDNILNNNSIVARFNSLGLTMLFTGDIEEIAENRLCELYSNTNKLNAAILKVAHHGSRTSSTENFLELVRPKIVFIGVGDDNRYGHPNDEVLDRIGLYTQKIYRTDEKGEVQLIYKNKRIKINSIF